MELRTLRYFLTIAREGSFSKAAKALHITQPTLSRQIKELEDELGKQLIIRGKRNITLSEEGLLLKRRAEEIFRLVEISTSEIHNLDEIVSGIINIGSAESEGFKIIAKIINSLQLKYPQIQLKLYSGTGYDVMERIDSGILDFGIVIEPVDLSKYDYLKLPYHDTWGLLMRSDSELASNDYITPSQLKNVPLLVSDQSLLKNEIAGWIGGNQRKANIIGTYNLLYNASIIVEESNVYALCLSNIVSNKNLKFVPLKPLLNAQLIIIWKKYQLLSKPTELLLNLLKDKIQ